MLGPTSFGAVAGGQLQTRCLRSECTVRFGEAYQQVAAGLATAITRGAPSDPGPPPSLWTSAPQRRYRFRNLSSSAVKLSFCRTHDPLHWVKLPNGEKTIGAGAEVAYPEREFTGLLFPAVERLTVSVSDGIQPTMSAGQLMIISDGGAVSVGDYSPPPRH